MCSSAIDTIFTTKNVQRAVQDVMDTDCLGDFLRVPKSRREEIKRQFSSVSDQVKAYISYSIEFDPVASWRSLIVILDAMEEKKAADAIRHLAEPLTGRVDTSN